MTDITELAKSLKAAANNSGADCWQAKKISGDFYVIRKGSYKRECGYTTYQPIAEIDHKPTRDYVALANPASILALVEALEEAQAENTAGVAGMAESYETIISMLRSRIAELESRTVKLPKLKMLEDYLAEVAIEERKQILVGVKLEFHRACVAAGIKVEAE
ncbi:TPA: ead/Ea22-like family protein [Escherichia coli]